MTRTLSQEVLEVLEEPRTAEGPVSLAYLARRFGVSSALMTSCAQQLVASGSAEPTMASRRGVLTIQGLLRHKSPAATRPEI
jgi:hypothetical protein